MEGRGAARPVREASALRVGTRAIRVQKFYRLCA